MAPSITLNEIKNVAGKLSSAINAHLKNIRSGKGDKSATLYEFYVAMSYLELLDKRNLSVIAVNADNQKVVFPRSPALGSKKYSYFEITTTGTVKMDVIARVYFGLKILSTDREKHRAPDITVASHKSRIDKLSSRVVLLLIDAKCRTAKSKNISIHEIDNFIRVNEKLSAPKKNALRALSWKHTDAVSCLVTNGNPSSESDHDLKKKGIAEVYHFGPGQSDKIRPK